MKKLKIIVLLLPFLVLLACKEDEFEPEAVEVVSCNTFRFNNELFELPQGECSEGLTVDYTVTEDGETYKFEIVCDGACIESGKTRK